MSLGTLLIIILILLLVGAFPTWLATRLIRAESIASFAHHILRVVFWRSKEKMRWVATRWIVAMMTNKHAARNWAASYFPRDAMCSFEHATIH